MKLNLKILYWISGIIGILFTILFFVLVSLNKISLGIGIGFIVLVISLVVIGDVIVWFVNTRKKSKEIDKKKLPTLSELREMCVKSLADLRYCEYEKENLWEDVLGLGNKNTPIYIKLVRGEFEHKLYGFVINVEEPDLRNGIKEYDDKNMHIDEIKNDILNRANLASSSPKEAINYSETRRFDPFTGNEVYHKEPIAKPEKIESTEGGLK